MRASIWIFLTPLAIAGCSGGFGTMDRVMKSWEGASIDAVISQWGYPHQEQMIAGRHIYRWYYTKQFSMPTTTVGTISRSGYVDLTTTGGGTLTGNCVRTLEVDQNNIVRRWEWSGNNCPFADVLEYRNWERKG